MVAIATIFQTLLQAYQMLHGTPDSGMMVVLFLVAVGLAKNNP
jgi:hypothetical protein